MKVNFQAIKSSPGEHQSLAVCMRALAAASGVESSYDSLCAALGLSLTAIAHPTDKAPRHWPNYGADRFLAETARLFGWTIRDLHPHDVGLNMLAAEEFPQHFELSYKPLIHRALEHGQPVLAWRGWEEPDNSVWGVIVDHKQEAFLGLTPNHTGLTMLTKPALQCYVVEQYDPRTPSSGELLSALIRHAHSYLSHSGMPVAGMRTGKSELLTGAKAFDAWMEWLTAQAPASGPSAARESHRSYACALSDNCLSAARFLNHTDALHSPDHAAVVNDLSDCCEAMASELITTCSPELLSVFWGTEAGHQELQDSLRTARAIEEQIADCVRILATA